MKQDRLKTEKNRIKKENTKHAIKTFIKEKTQEKLNQAQSLIDKLAKKRIIHKNKAARLKSKLAKQLSVKK